MPCTRLRPGSEMRQRAEAGAVASLYTLSFILYTTACGGRRCSLASSHRRSILYTLYCILSYLRASPSLTVTPPPSPSRSRYPPFSVRVTLHCILSAVLHNAHLLTAEDKGVAPRGVYRLGGRRGPFPPPRTAILPLGYEAGADVLVERRYHLL